MKAQRIFCILGCLLVIIFLVMLGERPSPISKSDSRDTKQPREISNLEENETVAEIEPLEAAEPLNPAAFPKLEAETVIPEPPKNWVKRTISEEWMDSPDKIAGRQRVRIVEADFKYPNLRLEEAVTVDPKTGIETVNLLRASVADHLMLGLKTGANLELAKVELNKMGYTVRSIEQDSYILVELTKFDSAQDQARTALELASLEEFIDHTEPDYLVFSCLTPNDPDYTQGKIWGLHNLGTTANTTLDADIDAPEAWSVRNDASGTIVAVTDTGIQYNHEDLATNMWMHIDGSRGLDAYDNDNDPMDIGGHGTHCAGIIGARGNNNLGLTGVAWNIKLMAVRFLGPNGGTTSDAIRSVNYARQNGANIISASWGGGGYSQSLYNAIKACDDIGIPFVAAAGNSSTNNDSIPHYPSSYKLKNIVSVASTSQKDILSTFSCYGQISVDIAAPGSAIWSTFIGTGTNTNKTYAYLSGTSMATPHVSGALALAMAQFPSDDMQSIIDRLYSSVDKLPALTGKVSTGGRLNLAKLLGNSAPDVANDNFVNAHVFTGDYGSWIGSNLGATRETDEDTFSKPGTGNKSLWYAFNTPHAGLVSLDVISELSGYHVVVYEGNQKNQLAIVAENSSLSSLNRELRFNSKPNTEYRVVIDTYAASNMRFRLDYNLAPTNDFFVKATSVTGNTFAATGYNRSATKELFEKTKPHAGKGQGKSVWWTWTAAQNGDFIINTSGSSFDTVLAIYTGTSIKNLTEVSSNDDRSPLDWTSQVTIPALAGTTYYIAVDSFREDSSGDIKLNGFRSGTLEIIRQPASLIVESGKRAVFDVSVLSDGDVYYQWFFNNQAIPGQTSVSLVIDPVQTDDFGNYKVEVRNSENLLTSNTAVLSEIQAAPKLTWSSGNQAVASGATITLSAKFSGALPMTFAWTKNDTPIANATSSTLTFPSSTVANAGIYKLTATNSSGSANTNFTATVVESPWTRWEWRRPGVINPQITDILVNGTNVYAITGNAILHSSDGENWTRHPFPQDFVGKYLAIKDGTFVCLGQNIDQNSSRVAISTNAIDWTVHQTTGSSMGSANKISVFKSQYIAAGTQTNGSVFRSSDGIEWTKIQTTDYQGQLVDMTGRGQPATDGNTLIISSPTSSSDGSIFLHRSSDGITWQEYRIFPANMVASSWSPGVVLYAFGKFHFFGSRIYTSTDGFNWQFSSTTNLTTYADTFFGVAGTDLYAFRPGPILDVVKPTTGQSTWMQVSSASDSFFTATATYGSKFIFGSNRGYLKTVSQVSDIHFPPEQMSSFDSMEFIDNQFYVFSQPPASGPTINFNSGDGVTWKAANSLDNYPVVYLGKAYGQYWAKTQSTQYDKLIGYNPLDTRLSSDPAHKNITYPSYIHEAEDGTALGIFSLSGSPGIYHRLNAQSSWTTANFPTTLPTKLTRFTGRWFSYTPGNYTASLLYTSTTGTTWTSTGITATNAIFTKHGNDIYCHYQTGTQTAMMLRKSTNGGTSWSAAQTTTGLPTSSQNIFAKRIFSFGNTLVMLPLPLFVTPGAPIRRIYYSSDGVTWIEGSLPTPVVDMAVGNGKMVAITTNGGIIESGSPHLGVNAPQVKITSPQPSSTHLLDSTIFIEGKLSDPENGNATYQAFLDDVLVASGSGTEFRFPVKVSSLQGHTLSVYATDSQSLKQIDTIRINAVSQDPRNLLHQAEGKTFIPSLHTAVFDGVFYAASGSILYRSLDGISWQPIPIPSFTETIQAIASGNGALVLQFTTGGIITTRDGCNWTHYQPNQSSYFQADPIRFQNGVFITTLRTLSTDSGVMTSEDGISWTVRSTIQSNRMTNVVMNPEGLMVGIRNSPMTVERSTNAGVSWQPISAFPSSGSPGTIGYHKNGKFVFIVPSIGKILISPDAYDWTVYDLPIGLGSTPTFILEGNMLFLGTTQNLLYASSDGISWSALSHPLKPSVICYSRGVFLSISGSDLMRSGDSVTWVPIAKPFVAANVKKILGNSETHLVIDNLGATWISKDNGNSWTACLTGGSLPTTNTKIGRQVIQLGNRLIAGGDLMVSSNDDGESWTAITIDGSAPPTNMQMVHMRASVNKVIGITYAFNSYKVVYTTNGLNFTSISSLPNQEWADLSWNGTEWMLLARNGDVFNSLDDGVSWQTVTAASSLTWGGSITWFNNKWVIIGKDSTSSFFSYNISSAGVFTKNLTLAFESSVSQQYVSTLVAHGKLMTWISGNQVFFTSNGNTWTNSNPIVGTPEFFDIYHTPEGFMVRGGLNNLSSVYAITSGPDALTWTSTSPPHKKFTAFHNMNERLFAFAGGAISEIHRHDMSLNISSLLSSSLGVGDTVQATVTINNHGVTPPTGSRWAVRAWLSTSRFSGNGRDVPVGEFELVGDMPVKGASKNFIVNYTLPNEIPTGDNFLILSLVSLEGIRESNSSNNTTISNTAAINIPEWAFNVATNGNGQVNRDFAVTRYPHKSLVSLTASAGKGATFTGWAGDAYSPNNQITILMDGNKSVQANFSNRATLQIYMSGMGEVTGLSDFGSYPVGNNANITASPAAGWEFSHWSGATEVETPAVSIPMDAPKTATAHFILPIATWKNSSFTPEQLADTEISGDQKDPDKDGIPTWIEYLHGSNPMNKDSTGRSPIKTENGQLICTYTRNVGAAGGATVTCQAGRDLSNWDSTDLEERIISTIDGIETVEARLPVAGNNKGFIRFRYDPAQP